MGSFGAGPLPARRTDYLVLSGEACLACRPDVYLSAVADRWGRLVAVFVSNRRRHRNRCAVAMAEPDRPRAAGGVTLLLRHARAGAGIREGLSDDLLVCR